MTSSTNDTGAQSITRDAKIGHVVGAVVTATGLAVVDYLGRLDFSTAPTFIATLAPVAVGLASGWITTYFIPRAKARYSAR